MTVFQDGALTMPYSGTNLSIGSAPFTIEWLQKFNTSSYFPRFFSIGTEFSDPINDDEYPLIIGSEEEGALFIDTIPYADKTGNNTVGVIGNVAPSFNVQFPN